MINKDATITINPSSIQATGSVDQKTLDKIKQLSSSPEWIKALKEMHNKQHDAGRNKKNRREG